LNTEKSQNRYLSNDYILKNPTWDREDSPWKAMLVYEALQRTRISPTSIVEVGCGAGDVLDTLRSNYPGTRLTGFDIAPAATTFWADHKEKDITFVLGDFLTDSSDHYDVALLLDVIEHLDDPFHFLSKIRNRADHFVFHFPLDLSALSVLRETPLLYVREKVGHIHYYTKSLALALLADCGFEVLDWKYSGAFFNAPQKSFKTRLAGVFRKILCALNRDLGVRALGGETLIVVARPSASGLAHNSK